QHVDDAAGGDVEEVLARDAAHVGDAAERVVDATRLVAEALRDDTDRESLHASPPRLLLAHTTVACPRPAARSTPPVRGDRRPGRAPGLLRSLRCSAQAAHDPVGIGRGPAAVDRGPRRWARGDRPRSWATSGTPVPRERG